MFFFGRINFEFTEFCNDRTFCNIEKLRTFVVIVDKKSVRIERINFEY